MPSIAELLESSRKELLDLSNRNRLLSMPIDSSRARIVHVKDELSDNVFRTLVRDKGRMSFRAGEASGLFGQAKDDDQMVDAEEVGLPQPDDITDPSNGEAQRHTDRVLQTSLSSEGLQRRLLALYRDAQTIMEEQGVNILYLALGRLKWFEANNSDIPRYAPLLLIPVQLTRKSASDRFKLSWREEEVQENLSLREKLKAEHGLTLPSFPTEDELVPSSYFQAVADGVVNFPRWEVQPNAVALAFFSFAKFLMYRDLDSRNWPTQEKLLAHEGLTSLLKDGFDGGGNHIPDETNLDELISADRLDHVVDADSSQTVAIEMVRNGRSMVVQGPPGTGKSQSITNLIAAAVIDGKKVLFVAEKLAALEVVKRRLEAAGLGAFCLELHSHKAHKRAVLAELDRTWQLGRPRGQELEPLAQRLQNSRERLNAHARMMHTGIGPHGLSPFQIIGRLSWLHDRGIAGTELTFTSGLDWNRATYEDRLALARDIAHRLSEMRPPGSHPWRGVSREAVLAIDLPAIKRSLERTIASLQALQNGAELLARVIHQTVSSSCSGVEAHIRLGQHVSEAPKIDHVAIAGAVWAGQLQDILMLVQNGLWWTESEVKRQDDFTENAYDNDLTPILDIIQRHGRSFFRFLNRDYRSAVVSLRSILRTKLPRDVDGKVGLLNDQIAGRKLRLSVMANDALGRSAFGTDWRGLGSSWPLFKAAVDWVQVGNAAGYKVDFRAICSKLDSTIDLPTVLSRSRTVLQEGKSGLEAIQAELSVDLLTAFGQGDLKTMVLAQTQRVVEGWLNNLDDLTRWSTWVIRVRKANELGMGSLIEAIDGGQLGASDIVDGFERGYLSMLLRDIVRHIPELAQFDGLEHDRLVDEFRKIDRDRLALARYRALDRHHQSLPARHAGAGTTGVLLDEIKRQRGHRPIRKLLRDAGSVVQAIKPVFMMSPLSVAQYLEPGAVEFDLMIIDEASQVRPVDAFGAFARCKQHVVIGDSRQLPPTRFFAKLTDDEEQREPEGDAPLPAEAKDMESILDLCCARGLPESMLRWHYRSRHHSLIAVSNHEFYENKLFIVPSPFLSSSGLGLGFTHVQGAVYDRGQTATNRIEAEAVCRAVIHHARHSPDVSLGVAAFSIRQQQLILDLLEGLRRESPDLESFFDRHVQEPFFVKNLENVQGDERDVILISVGYGPDKSGFMAMNFGPLSNEGGERRLNVLISRAKKRCQVFASFRSDDIDLQRAQARGVRALKTFLRFAETGRLGVAEQTQREQDSPFEEAVFQAIQQLGYEVHPQVGLAGFFVDLGVVDPSKPGRYLLGVECDGATYHSSRSARDRDRLREAVLVDHGWRIHRIWSTDWFQRREEQLRRLVVALEEAKTEASVNAGGSTSEPEVAVTREASNPVITDAASALSTTYSEAQFGVPKGREPHEIPATQMAEIVFRIVQHESPIHEDEVAARVRDLWGLGRAGSRIRKSVKDVVWMLAASGQCKREEECLVIPGQAVPIRNRSAVSSASLRRLEFIPKMEIREAIVAVINSSHGASPDKLTTTVARMLGFSSTSSDLASEIRNQIETLKNHGRIAFTDGVLRPI